MALPAPSVVSVVLNWNGWERTVSCLSALSQVQYPRLTMIVVDNGSTDHSPDRIRERFPGLAVLETGKNLGFAGGNNVGIRHAMQLGADYIWLLNNDAEPAPNALNELIKIAESNPLVGEVGSVLVDPGPLGVIQAWGGGRASYWLGYNRESRVQQANDWFDYLTAASVLVRVGAFHEVGLLDERYFLYWEDVDFSFRLRARGWKLAVAEGSIVRHQKGASTGSSRASRDRYSTASAIRFLHSYSPAPWFSVPFFIAKRLAMRVVTWQPRRLTAVVRGVNDYLHPTDQRGDCAD